MKKKKKNCNETMTVIPAYDDEDDSFRSNIGLGKKKEERISIRYYHSNN